MRARQTGFTLIEVLVVTVVIAVVASISASSIFGAFHRAKQRATMADMRSIARALETYSVDHSFLPDDSGGLTALVDDLIPYATNNLPIRDHWGHEIAYVKDADENYSIESFGKDGADGADITLSGRFEYDLDLVLYNGIFVAAPE